MLYLWYLGKVAQRKRFPIPRRLQGEHIKTAHTYVAHTVFDSDHYFTSGRHSLYVFLVQESLELRDDKVNRHIKIKEAALEFSRVQAKINEAERESIKRRSTNFNQMAQKAKLTANIGRGPRSSFVNYSTVKLG